MQHHLPLFRRKIDQIDRQLLDLISRRARLVQQVGQVKQRLGLPVFVPGREKQILRRLRKINPGPLSEGAIQALFSELITQCRQLETPGSFPARTPSSSKFPSIAIIGVGLMGGSFALALRKYAPQCKVTGFDPALRTQATQGRLHMVRSIREALQSDWIVLAMPISGIRDFLRTTGPALHPGTVVIDLGSTKQTLCQEAAKYLPPDVDFIGTHPLAGRSLGGFKNADPDLFLNRSCIIAPPPKKTKSSSTALGHLTRLVRTIGGLPVFLSAEEHDRTLAFTSHLPQLLSTALASSVEQFFKGKPLHGPGFLDMTRLAESDYSVWRDILRTNQRWIKKVAFRYQAELNYLLRLSRTGQAGPVFSRAHRLRRRLLKKG